MFLDLVALVTGEK